MCWKFKPLPNIIYLETSRDVLDWSVTFNGLENLQKTLHLAFTWYYSKHHFGWNTGSEIDRRFIMKNQQILNQINTSQNIENLKITMYFVLDKMYANGFWWKRILLFSSTTLVNAIQIIHPNSVFKYKITTQHTKI